MSFRKLPIHPRPPLTGKLRHAYPLSILATDERYLPWFHSQYIQLFCPLARGFPHTQVDFFYPPHYPSLPQLQVQTVDRRLVSGTFDASLSDFIAGCIEQELYVRLYVDEFHLPERAAFRRFHFVHNLLLFGCDRPGARFDVLGFREDGRFGVSQVSFPDLERALHSDELLEQIEATERGERHPALGDPSAVWLARHRPERKVAFDPDLVAGLLQDYLESRNTAERFRMIDISYYGQEGAGLEVYECIDRRLAYSLAHPDFYDLLSLHTLWEHKKCMFGRLEYMEEHGFLDPGAGFSARYRPIEQEARILRMMMLRAKLRREAEVVARMRPRLKKLAGEEAALLERLVEKLE